MPQLTSLFPRVWPSWDKVNRVGQAFRDFFGAIIQEHEESPDATDFTHAYLQRIQEERDPNSSFFQERGRTLS